MALISISGLSDFLDGDRTVIALIPALSVAYLHFQTNYLPFRDMYIFVILSAIIAGVSKDTEMLTAYFNIKYEWIVKSTIIFLIFILTLGLHGYAVWQLFNFGGESRLYIVIFTVQILATTMLVADRVLVLLVKGLSKTLELLILLAQLILLAVFELGERIAERIPSI